MKQIDSVTSPSLQLHRRQFLWHILLPFFIISAIIIAGAALLIPWGQSAAGAWRDISIMWLLVPVLILFIIVISVLAILIYGFARLTPIIPRYTGQAQRIASNVAAGTRKVADGIHKPFILLKIAGEKIRSLYKK
jgi:hypothetical protein